MRDKAAPTNGMDKATRNKPGDNPQPRKKLGIIGGMGPAATAHFYALVTSMTQAETDQEHLEAHIISRPSIPDRTAYILGKSDQSPVPHIVESGRMLAKIGAGLIAIPCVTSHFFYDELQEGINVPIINMVRETAAFLSQAQIKAAGIMATDGAVRSGLFQNELNASGIRAIAPSETMQARVMDLIYNNIKANRPFDIESFKTVTNELRANGAERILLACTEFSLIRQTSKLSSEYVDVLEILAKRSIELCGYTLIK